MQRSTGALSLSFMERALEELHLLLELGDLSGVFLAELLGLLIFRDFCGRELALVVESDLAVLPNGEVMEHSLFDLLGDQAPFWQASELLRVAPEKPPRVLEFFRQNAFDGVHLTVTKRPSLYCRAFGNSPQGAGKVPVKLAV